MPPFNRVRPRPRVVYNEIEPFAVRWLENLSAGNHIAPGVVDATSVSRLDPSAVRGAVQFHAFAGIGAWSYALRLAGWPDDRPVWTGSCPCQPFSPAGDQLEFDDPRHLWPSWYKLIKECGPKYVFGEQVEGAAGRRWLDLVHDDLERAGYAVGAAVLPAASVGAPHLRHRIYFGAVRLADADEGRRLEQRERDGGAERGAGREAPQRHDAGGRGADGRLADAALGGRGEGRAAGECAPGQDGPRPSDGRLARPWESVEYLPCRDGKLRPTQPGLLPLAHGAPARVGRLRGYGNAIVAPLAAAFVRSFMEAVDEVG